MLHYHQISSLASVITFKRLVNFCHLTKGYTRTLKTTRQMLVSHETVHIDCYTETLKKKTSTGHTEAVSYPWNGVYWLSQAQVGGGPIHFPPVEMNI